jgi:hypothetical protein
MSDGTSDTAQLVSTKDKKPKKCHPHKKHSDCGTVTATVGVTALA